MFEIPPPEIHFLNAALGWLELGNPEEARNELDKIPDIFRLHPDVLSVSWELDAKQKNWDSALEKARCLIKAMPNRPDGWVKQSYCLHALKMTAEALAELVTASEKFPKVSIIPYNVACYHCQLGNLNEAQRWLSRAVRLGGKDQIKSMAMKDPDLVLLRPNIEQL